MTKSKSLLAIMLASASLMMAQTTDKSKQILDQLSAKTKAYSSIYADFTFLLENTAQNTKETSVGSIKVKGNKYKVSLMGVESYFDGKDIWAYMPDAGEVNVSTPDPNDDNTLNPAKIFTMYEKGFKYKYVGEKTENGKVMHEIDLFPDARNKPYSRIKLMIEKDNLQLHSFKQIGKDGSNYTVTIKKFVTNQPYADTDFTFNKAANPKVEIVDLR